MRDAKHPPPPHELLASCACFQLCMVPQTTGIDSNTKKFGFLFYLHNFHSQKVKTLRLNHTVLRRAALSGPRQLSMEGGYLASCEKSAPCRFLSPSICLDSGMALFYDQTNVKGLHPIPKKWKTVMQLVKYTQKT
jgi:hypothetical protein